ncbi:MAG: caspase family protein [Ekhidna sp.]|nr:caspase family protein [Ekhidna sp.]
MIRITTSFISTLAFIISLAQGYENKTALIIGNTNYSVGKLKNPVNDADLLSSTLADQGFDVITKYDLDRAGMIKSLREFQKEVTVRKGIALFYYSGHGLQFDGDNYLVPIDADVQNEFEIESECLKSSRILRMLEFMDNPLNIVILDACRNNPFGSSYRSTTQGLAQPTVAPTGSIIAFSTAPSKVASDGEGSNGLYTQELVKAISTPNLSIEEVFKQTRRNVASISSGKQVPWENSSLLGDFYFIEENEKLNPIATSNELSHYLSPKVISGNLTQYLERKQALKQAVRQLESLVSEIPPEHKSLFSGEYIGQIIQEKAFKDFENNLQNPIYNLNGVKSINISFGYLVESMKYNQEQKLLEKGIYLPGAMVFKTKYEYFENGFVRTSTDPSNFSEYTDGQKQGDTLVILNKGGDILSISFSNFTYSGDYLAYHKYDSIRNTITSYYARFRPKEARKSNKMLSKRWIPYREVQLNEMGLISSVINPLDDYSRTRLSYNDQSQIQKVESKKINIEYSYDDNGRLSGKVSNGTQVKYNYEYFQR